MSDYHQSGYGPQAGGPYGAQAGGPYGAQPGWNNGAPQGGSYGYPSAPGGYGQPGYQQGFGGPTPPSNSTGPAMWAHLGALLTVTVGAGVCCGLGAFLGWIAPMSVRSNSRTKHDPYVQHHALQAINYGISQAIVSAVGLALYFGVGLIGATGVVGGMGGIGIPMMILILLMAGFGITGLVCAIIATVKANRGELWNYPTLIAWPLVKR